MLAAPASLMAAGVAPEAGTPPEMVATYQTLADTILGAKKTEHNLVKSILTEAYHNAQLALASAKDAIKTNQNARPSIETLAALVSQIANEGDAAVAAVRNRLLEGGHHHNAKGEQQGVYDEGFVIVTRAAKKSFLDSAMRIGKMAASPNAQALEAEWETVAKQFHETVK